MTAIAVLKTSLHDVCLSVYLLAKQGRFHRKCYVYLTYMFQTCIKMLLLLLLFLHALSEFQQVSNIAYMKCSSLIQLLSCFLLLLNQHRAKRNRYLSLVSLSFCYRFYLRTVLYVCVFMYSTVYHRLEFGFHCILFSLPFFSSCFYSLFNSI